MITLWTSPGCGPCYAIKRALKDTPFVERDVSTASPDAVEHWRRLGWSTPIVQSPEGEFSGFVPPLVQRLIDNRGR